jgi:predicted nuclease with TOPRIM domain
MTPVSHLPNFLTADNTAYIIAGARALDTVDELMSRVVVLEKLVCDVDARLQEQKVESAKLAATVNKLVGTVNMLQQKVQCEKLVDNVNMLTAATVEQAKLNALFLAFMERGGTEVSR